MFITTLVSLNRTISSISIAATVRAGIAMRQHPFSFPRQDQGGEGRRSVSLLNFRQSLPPKMLTHRSDSVSSLVLPSAAKRMTRGLLPRRNTPKFGEPSTTR